MVCTDERQGGRIAVRRHQCGGQLKSIGRSKRVAGQKACGAIPNAIEASDLRPCCSVIRQQLMKSVGLLCVHRIFATKSGECGPAFDLRAPPCDRIGIGQGEATNTLAEGLTHQQGDNRR